MEQNHRAFSPGYAVLQPQKLALLAGWVMGTERVPLMGAWSSAHGWKPEVLGKGFPAKERVVEAAMLRTCRRLPTCGDRRTERLPQIRKKTKPTDDVEIGRAVQYCQEPQKRNSLLSM